jgi:hypothetical protein
MGRRGDVNGPAMLVTPTWGPDASSRRLATLNAINANPVSPANIGIGTRPAPIGASFTEGTKSDTWLTPQQNYRGVVVSTTNPTLKNTPASASLPSAMTQINPVLVTMSMQQLNPNGGLW